MKYKADSKPNRIPVRCPKDGTFELTVRCNLHCKMCLFRHDDSENNEITKKELTAEQWISMARQAAEAGTGSLLITGGEPLLRTDFCKIWEKIYRFGFLITLYTNATLVTPKVMETLRKYPPHKIGITLYGAGEETYEAVCGNGKAFIQTMKGIRLLLTLPSMIEFRTTIIRDNYHDVETIEKLIHREFGEEYCLIQTRMVTKAVRGACADVEACRLTPEDNVKLAFRRGIASIRCCTGDKYDERNLVLRRVERSEKQESFLNLTLLGCQAGMSQYTITWDGKLLGCQMLGEFETNALQEGLQEAWMRFPAVVKPMEPNNTCITCKSRDLCSSCAASRLAETGNISGCPGYVCRDTAVIQQLLDRGGIEK